MAQSSKNTARTSRPRTRRRRAVQHGARACPCLLDRYVEFGRDHVAACEAVFIARTKTSTIATTSQRQSAALSSSHQAVRQTATMIAVDPGVVLVPQHETDAARRIAKALQPIGERERLGADACLAGWSFIRGHHHILRNRQASASVLRAAEQPGLGRETSRVRRRGMQPGLRAHSRADRSSARAIIATLIMRSRPMARMRNCWCRAHIASFRRQTCTGKRNRPGCLPG